MKTNPPHLLRTDIISDSVDSRVVAVPVCVERVFLLLTFQTLITTSYGSDTRTVCALAPQR